MGRRGVHLAHSGLAFRLFEQVPQVLQRNALLGQFLFDGIANHAHHQAHQFGIAATDGTKVTVKSGHVRR